MLNGSRHRTNGRSGRAGNAGLRGGPLLLGLLVLAPTAASEKEELIRLRNTTLNLIEALVQKGVLDRKSADAMIRGATEKAAADARQGEGAAADGAGGSPASAAGPAVPPAAEPANPPPPASAEPAKAEADPPGSVHIGYVPDIVKDQIRKEVRKDLREELVRQVKAEARAEQWGIPAALPEWVARIHPFLDARLRFSGEFYGAGNATYYDWQAINKEGGISAALARGNAYLNTTVDRLRITERFRVGLDAAITEGLTAGFRLTTTNFYSPVSTNQTLGNYEQTWIVALDRAFLQYDLRDGKGYDWLTLTGGRIPNPFLSTEMMYSAMLSFEGLVGTFRFPFGRDNPAVEAYRVPAPTGRYGVNLGPTIPNSVWATAGVLPLQDINFSSHDKWLYAAQAGVDWLFHQESRFKLGAAYYGYTNVRAIRNSYDSLNYDWTAPQFMQKGNSLVAINDAQNQSACNTGALGAQNVCLVALASNFQLFDVMAIVDEAEFAPTHILLTTEYAHNFGFDSAYILSQFGDSISPQTNAYLVRLDVGRPELRRFNDWNLFFSYRYLQRDSLLDAFNDPIFHQGGTDVEGWTLGVQYGLASNTWLDLRWMSADELSGPPLSIDTLNLDVNARF